MSSTIPSLQVGLPAHEFNDSQLMTSMSSLQVRLLTLESGDRSPKEVQSYI